MIDPEYIQQAYNKWTSMLEKGEKEKLKKVIAIDEKSNEITAIPKLLDKINIKNSVVTIDAMGTQTAIAEKIKKQKGDYRRTSEKNHGSADVREYYQTNSISWLNGREKWKGIKSMGMVIRTYKGVSEKRYYISSLNPDINLFSNAVRGHWSVKSMHRQLDVNFKEDSNHTLNKTAAENQNIIRKWCLLHLHSLFFSPISINVSVVRPLSSPAVKNINIPLI